MQSKEKRKINPRRRLLMRPIVAIVAIAILLVLGLRALKPIGAQIVYIAPDENGYDAIWLADLNVPENPRQLTFHEGNSIFDLQTSQENSIVFYVLFATSITSPYELHIINLDSGKHSKLPICQTGDCGDYQLHPNGQWLIFEDFGKPSNQIYAYDLRTFEEHLVFDFGSDSLYSHFPSWAGNTDRLVFRIANNSEIDQLAFYDVQEQAIVETITLSASVSVPYFSHDGNLYVHLPISTSFDTSEPILREVRDISNPNRILYMPNPYVRISDWHPDNEHILFIDHIYSEYRITRSNVYIYNINTEENEILIDNAAGSYSMPTFNATGTQILYRIYSTDTPYPSIVIYDIENEEVNTLPLSGTVPLWVNGGR